MQLIDLYRQHFAHKSFDSVEEHHKEVLRYTSSLSEELSKIYKYVLDSSSDVMDEFDIIINGEN